MIFIRSLLFNTIFPIIVMGCSIVALCSGIFSGRRGIVAAARANGFILAFMMKMILNLKIKVSGYENLPNRSDYIVACKHQSAWETIYLHNIIDNPIVIMKRELLFIPIFGQVLWLAKSIMIERKKGRSTIPRLIQDAKKSFSRGESIFIFPEGTRAPVGTVGKYRYGIAAIYEKCKVPVVPIALNSGYFWPRRSFLKYPGIIEVQILPAIQPGLSGSELLEILKEKIENAVGKMKIDDKLCHTSKSGVFRPDVKHKKN